MSWRSWRSDAALVGWGALTFAALLASFMSFRPVRDALVLDGRPDDIPWLFLGTFIAGLIASPLWSHFLARRQKRRVVPIAFHVFAVCLLVFSVLVRAAIEPVAVGRAFYIWSSVFNLFVVSVFWSLLADLIGPQKAKSLFGPIAAGGTLGAIVGPWLTTLLVEHVGVANILVLSAFWLELAVVGVWQLRRHGEAAEAHATDGARPPDDPTPSNMFTGLDRVTKSPYLIAIVGYVLCTATAATFLYLEQASIVKEAFVHLPDKAARIARTDYFGTLETWTQIITFVAQMIIASRLLKWLGPGIVLCILPLAQLSAIIALSTTASLAVLAIVMVGTRATTHGLTRPARELLFTVVDRDEKYHAKNAIDLVAYRFGDLGSSWLHKGLVALGAGSTTLLFASVPLTVGWIALAIGLGVGFRRRANE
ncbi:MAG: NTP/NDP exchange transporter [Kofleriaceae bacterium]